MNLLAHINSLPILRPLDFPKYLHHICLILYEQHLVHVETIMRFRPTANLESLVLIDYNAKTAPKEHNFTVGGKISTVPVLGLEALLYMPHLERVIFSPPDDLFGSSITSVCRLLAPYGLKIFYICQSQPLLPIAVKHDPYFYRDNTLILESLYNMLADEDSREVYAARIKSILTAEIGYMPISAHPEYYHPLVRPEPGDVMLDGGVSDNVGVQLQFIESVGPTGTVLGFEPMPDMFRIAKLALAPHKRYRLFCQGLGEKKERLSFAPLRDSSHVSADGKGTIQCEVIDVDTFLAEHKIRRLNCLKLDVEGSELAALRGASKAIQTYKPKLIVCLYHKVRDMIDIPEYIKSLVPEYELYIAHSSYQFIDTILYAGIPDKR
jgi:FkbM family methyltransferase